MFTIGTIPDPLVARRVNVAKASRDFCIFRIK